MLEKEVVKMQKDKEREQMNRVEGDSTFSAREFQSVLRKGQDADVRNEELEIRKGGFKAFAHQIALARGETQAIRVRLEPLATVDSRAGPGTRPRTAGAAADHDGRSPNADIRFPKLSQFAGGKRRHFLRGDAILEGATIEGPVGGNGTGEEASHGERREEEWAIHGARATGECEGSQMAVGIP